MKKRFDGETAQQRRERFVRMWQAAGSVGEVAEAMGVTKHGAAVAAVNLRKMGVPLKRFPGGPPPVSLDEIARLKALCDGEAG